VTDTRSEFHDLQALYLPVAGAVLLIVFGANALVRYRARPGHTPRPTRERHVREAVIAAVIAAIVAVLLTATYRANDQEAKANRAPGFAVDVLVFKWGWQFTPVTGGAGRPRAGRSAGRRRPCAPGTSPRRVRTRSNCGVLSAGSHDDDGAVAGGLGVGGHLGTLPGRRRR
jgi:heme/copper-type cytochrome/quinol oxidase subunit 2